ncbi:hypothetical protein EDC56_2792 [Sinobacterium caligoides]|uniref:Uncharacterized protein n=1 Tax=Sinobacterium caligoides TaxID=933926 RepID=A0A3N2DK43_9GAMM|nr:hypothetical protein [Sinobacterium caligoides]ROS00156.1 hypothetical protein EDC56_2792 [Sinobacterium caligoides]
MNKMLKGLFMISTVSLLHVETLAAEPNFCLFPTKAVLETLTCIETESADCAYAGYAPDFIKRHNGELVTVNMSGPEYWRGAFAVADFDLDVNHVRRAGLKAVSLRYVETVSLVTGQRFQQHEHALVTVDKDCKIIEWDQYGDNKEQLAVDQAVLTYLNAVGAVQSDLVQ